jgi:hypothetical protein
MVAALGEASPESGNRGKIPPSLQRMIRRIPRIKPGMA